VKWLVSIRVVHGMPGHEPSVGKGRKMEFLLVHFPRSRRVKVDDKYNGRTEELIPLEAGHHTVRLGPPYNFTPDSREVLLKDTSPLTPLEVSFDDRVT
jgi:hypothetical protein